MITILIFLIVGVATAMSQNLESKETLSHRLEQTPAMPLQLLPMPLRQFSPKIIFRKLHPDPEHCYQVYTKTYLVF